MFLADLRHKRFFAPFSPRTRTRKKKPKKKPGFWRMPKLPRTVPVIQYGLGSGHIQRYLGYFGTHRASSYNHWPFVDDGIGTHGTVQPQFHLAGRLGTRTQHWYTRRRALVTTIINYDYNYDRRYLLNCLLLLPTDGPRSHLVRVVLTHTHRGKRRRRRH